MELFRKGIARGREEVDVGRGVGWIARCNRAWREVNNPREEEGGRWIGEERRRGNWRGGVASSTLRGGRGSYSFER